MEAIATQIVAGEQIGPYSVVRRLGAGGMGEVYLARHRHLGRDAAVKVLLPEISMNQTMVSRFFTEARATRSFAIPTSSRFRLRCPARWSRLHSDGVPARRESADHALPHNPAGARLPQHRRFCRLGCRCLASRTHNGIVHRDLKPDNTFLTVVPNRRDFLTVKVLDFGIAKLLSAKDTAKMRPARESARHAALHVAEQCRGIPTIGHWADIYSLGCVMFEMVAGRPPFVSEAPGDLLMAHISQQHHAVLLSARRSRRNWEPGGADAGQRSRSPATIHGEVAQLIEVFLGVRIADFNTVLRRPAGFTDPSPPVTTAILTPNKRSPPG